MPPPIDGYLGYSPFLAPANNAATSNYVKCPYGTWEKKGPEALDLNRFLHIRLARGALNRPRARLHLAQFNPHRRGWDLGTCIFFKLPQKIPLCSWH